MNMKSSSNEMTLDYESVERICGDKNYFEALQEIKNDEELNSFSTGSDYSIMFMTF